MQSMKSASLLLLAFLFSSVTQAKSLKDIEKAGSITVATEGVFPPFNQFKGKELTGFEVDLANLLFEKMHLKREWKTFPFDALLIGLAQDRYDLVVASHGITPERAKAVDFSDPHYCTGGVIISLVGGPKTEADLKGKVVAVEVGTTYISHLNKIPGIKEVKTYPKDTDSLQNLLMGHADAWATDKFVALEAMKKTPGKLQMGDMLFQEKVAMAVAKGNKELLARVNAALAESMKDGSYTKLSNSYFQQDIRCR